MDTPKNPIPSMTGVWRRYDTTDSLASASIFAIAQDHLGRLWLGTSAGVCVYDGLTWSTVTRQHGLADNTVWTLAFDHDGVLWVGTYQGLSRYDGQSWTSFSTVEGLPDNRIRTLLVTRSGDLLAGTHRGLGRYDGQKWTAIPISADDEPSMVINTLMEDHQGALWIGTQHGVLRDDGKTWCRDTNDNGLPDNRVRVLLQDRHGRIWAGTHTGLCRYDGVIWAPVRLPAESPEQPHVMALFEDRDGLLWIGTDQGLVRYDDVNWQTYADIGHELGSPIVNALFEDREGLLWVGTQNGLSRYDPAIITITDPEQRLAQKTVLSLLEDEGGTIWIGTYRSGLYRTDGQEWTMVDGLSGSRVRALAHTPESQLVVGTNSGIVWFDGLKQVDDPTAGRTKSTRVRALAVDRRRRLWIGTNKGVYLVEEGCMRHFTTADGLGSDRVRSLAVDQDNTVWAGTSHGVSRYDGRGWTTYTADEGLPHDEVYALAVDQSGALWAGTQAGVCRYDGRIWTPLADRDVLVGRTITAIAPDEDGTLWFGTQHGVIRYDGQFVQALTSQDGLVSDAVYTILRRRNGEVWVGTDRGITCYRPPAPAPPSVLIDAIIGDQQYGPSDGLFNRTGRNTGAKSAESLAARSDEAQMSVSIPITAKTMVFEFHGISHKTCPDGLIYRYRLHGYDESWQTTRERRVAYHNLPPARYTFEVIAVDRDLTPSTPATAIVYRYDPPTLRDRERLVDWVRMETANMRSSADLERIIGVIRKGCLTQQVPVVCLGFCIIDEQKGHCALTLTDEQGAVCEPLDVPISSVDLFKIVVTHWRHRQRYTVAWTPEMYRTWGHLLHTWARLDLQDLFVSPGPCALHFAPFTQGMLYVGSETPLTEDDIRLVEALAGAFAVAYARYQDFLVAEAQSQKLEAQNRALAAANARLQELDRMKSEFLSHVSHDLRTPLTAIRRAVDNLLEGVCGALTDHQLRTIARIHRSTLRLSGLIEELLDLASIEAGRVVLKRTRIDLWETARTVIEEMQPIAVERGITLTLLDVARESVVYADPKRIYQIVLNLVDNALKYTEKDGCVELYTAMDGTEGRLSVTDTGVGIPAAELDAIFESFYQVGDSSITHEGTGLGLAIVKKLVEFHGGRIGVESTVGQGSTFWFTLPVYQGEE